MPTWDEHMAGAETVEEVLGLAVGAGSVCWEHLEGTGVFQSEAATDIVDKACTRIRELMQ
jgi:hypothetical protein